MDQVPLSFQNSRTNRQTHAPTFPGTPKPTGRLSSAAMRHHSTSPKPSDGPSAILGQSHCVAFTTESSFTLSIRPLFLYLLFLILYGFHCFANPVLLTILVPLFPFLLLLKIVQNLVYKVPYLLPNAQAIYLLIRISYLISLCL